MSPLFGFDFRREEGHSIVEIQICTRKFVAHKIPGISKRGGIGDVGAISSFVRSTDEQRHKPTGSVDDETFRVTSFGESARLVLVIENGELEGLLLVGGEVLANK